MKKLPILKKSNYQFLDKNNIIQLINKFSNSKDDNHIRKKIIINNKLSNIKTVLNLRNNKSYNKALTKLITYRNNLRRKNLAYSTDNLFDSECFYHKENFPNFISSRYKGEADSIYNLIMKGKLKKVKHRNKSNNLSYTNSFLSDNFNYSNLNKKEEKIIDLKKNKTFLIKNKNDAKENSKTKRISVKSIILDEQSGKNNNCSQLYDKYMASKLVNGLNGLNRIKNLIEVNGFNGYKIDKNNFYDIYKCYYFNKRNKKENSYYKPGSFNKDKDKDIFFHKEDKKYFRNSVRKKFNSKNKNKSIFNNNNKNNENIVYIKNEVIKFYKKLNYPSKLDFYRDWIRENGKSITINDIYFYLNNIINIKIRKDEIKNFIFNKLKLKEINELNYEDFKNIFFGTENKNKNKTKTKKEVCVNLDSINDKIKNNKINIINLIESIKEKFYSEINKNADNIIKNCKQNYKNKYELYFDEFYDLINSNILVEFELYFNDIIKRIFHEHCDKDNRINVMKFLEKIKENKNNDKTNDKNNNIKDILNEIKKEKVNFKNNINFNIKEIEENKRQNLSKKKMEEKTKNEINKCNNYIKVDNIKNKINNEIQKEKKSIIKDLKSNNIAIVGNDNDNNVSKEEIKNSSLTFNWINSSSKRKGEKNSDIINLL